MRNTTLATAEDKLDAIKEYINSLITWNFSDREGQNRGMSVQEIRVKINAYLDTKELG